MDETEQNDRPAPGELCPWGVQVVGLPRERGLWGGLSKVLLCWAVGGGHFRSLDRRAETTNRKDRVKKGRKLAGGPEVGRVEHLPELKSTPRWPAGASHGAVRQLTGSQGGCSAQEYGSVCSASSRGLKLLW